MKEKLKKMRDIIKAPTTGKVVRLEQVSDPVFSSKAMGDGVAILSSTGIIDAPIGGTVTFVNASKHAYGITSESGVEMLIHIGIDTVNLKGEGFTTTIKEGQKIKAGETLATINLAFFKEKKLEPIVILVITNLDEGSKVEILQTGQVNKGERIASLQDSKQPISTDRKKDVTIPEIAQKILNHIGGKENVSSVEHCSTRLRVIVKDQNKINTEAVEDIPKVKGSVFNAGQYQIILGTGLVNKVYEAFVPLVGNKTTNDSFTGNEEKPKMNFQRAIRIFGDIFVPIIPVLVATGLFMGLRGLLTQEAVLNLIGLTPESIPEQFLMFTQILTDTAFAFLPALIAWSTFKAFGGTPILGIVLGLMLVSSVLPNAYEVGQKVAEPIIFFGFIKVVGYQGSVLPAFVTGILGSKIEIFLRKKVPDSLDLIITPFLTLLLGLSLALFFVGPIFHEVELLVLYAVEYLLNLPFGIGGLVYGSFGQLLGIFGIHHILNFLEITMLSQDGWNYLNPIGTCGNMAQAGAVLAVAIKTVSPKMKQIAFPSAFSASLGITEPAVFGVTLRLVKPFIMAMIGGGIGGFLASILDLRATGMALTGIPGTLLYLNELLPLYILVNLVSFSIAFILTWFFGYKKEQTL